MPGPLAFLVPACHRCGRQRTRVGEDGRGHGCLYSHAPCPRAGTCDRARTAELLSLPPHDHRALDACAALGHGKQFTMVMLPRDTRRTLAALQREGIASREAKLALLWPARSPESLACAFDVRHPAWCDLSARQRRGTRPRGRLRGRPCPQRGRLAPVDMVPLNTPVLADIRTRPGILAGRRRCVPLTAFLQIGRGAGRPIDIGAGTGYTALCNENEPAGALPLT